VRKGGESRFEAGILDHDRQKCAHRFSENIMLQQAGDGAMGIRHNRRLRAPRVPRISSRIREKAQNCPECDGAFLGTIPRAMHFPPCNAHAAEAGLRHVERSISC
jgi:hypothetical protein